MIVHRIVYYYVNTYQQIACILRDVLTLYSVAKTHGMPYLYRSLHAKEPYE